MNIDLIKEAKKIIVRLINEDKISCSDALTLLSLVDLMEETETKQKEPQPISPNIDGYPCTDPYRNKKLKSNITSISTSELTPPGITISYQMSNTGIENIKFVSTCTNNINI
jgi:hypothetical protein